MPNNYGTIFGPGAANPAGNSQQSTTLTGAVLDTITKRFPTFYQGAISDFIQPIMDLSMYFPLDFQAVRLQATTVAEQTDFIFHPKKGKHWLVDIVQAVGVAGVNNIVQLLIFHQDSTQFITKAIISTPVIQDVFLLGGSAYIYDNASATTTIYTTCEQPIYLQSRDSLVVRVFDTSLSATQVFATINYTELPENQSFGPLMGR